MPSSSRMILVPNAKPKLFLVPSIWLWIRTSIRRNSRSARVRKVKGVEAESEQLANRTFCAIVICIKRSEEWNDVKRLFIGGPGRPESSSTVLVCGVVHSGNLRFCWNSHSRTALSSRGRSESFHDGTHARGNLENGMFFSEGLRLP